MFLKNKIKASSLAEVVIALSIVALCFGVASLVFLRSTMVSTKFLNVRQQTEIQSQLWEQMHNAASPDEYDEVQLQESKDLTHDSISVFTYTGADDRIIWQQQWTPSEK